MPPNFKAWLLSPDVDNVDEEKGSSPMDLQNAGSLIRAASTGRLLTEKGRLTPRSEVSHVTDADAGTATR